MASSRRPGRAEAGPVDAVRAATAPLGPSVRIAVAFSGGLDSTVLLHAAARVLPHDRLLALHVDHGLQAGSAAWAGHCEGQAESLGVTCLSRRLADAPAAGESVEAWAREARYRALVAMARDAGAAVLLTAHHADDRLETFLLRLARGAGLDGLVGIEAETSRDGLRLLRPLLGLPRSRIEAWAREQGLCWIEDPSNADERLPRNAIRRQLVPAIDRILPSLRERLPDTIDALREARDRLRELERRDLAGVEVESREFGRCLSLSAWRALPPARRPGVLRRWLAGLGARMPSRARLAEIVRQLESPREDTHVALSHDGRTLRRHRDLVILAGPSTPAAAEAVGSVAVAPAGSAAGSVAMAVRWAGERRIECPALGGALLIEPVEQAGKPGLRAELLRAGDLELRLRRGGERLRTRPGGPHRSLKNLFQEQGVPTWLRPMLPVLWSGARPVWVARLGADADCLAVDGERYELAWQPDGFVIDQAKQ